METTTMGYIGLGFRVQTLKGSSVLSSHQERPTMSEASCLRSQQDYHVV